MSDVNKIRDTVEIIKQMANTELCVNLSQSDKNSYQEYMKELFPEFSQNYVGLFKKIIFREDLTMLNAMLKNLEDLNNGVVQEKDVTTNIGESLAEKYLYPVLGKPESTTEKKPEFITK